MATKTAQEGIQNYIRKTPRQLLINCIHIAVMPLQGKNLTKFYPLRVLKSWYRELIGMGGVASVNGFKMFLDPFDSLNLKNGRSEYEREAVQVFKRELRPDDVVLDIGANIGYFTLLAARQAKKVYAFEPNPKVFGVLSKNVDMNGFADKVVLREEATAESAGEEDFFLCDSTSGFHASGIRTKVQVVSIDEAVPAADFIKIDVEGAELAAIKGGRRVFGGARVVMFELHPRLLERSGVHPEELFKMVEGLGFSLSVVEGGSMDGLVDHLKKINSSVNILAKRE